MSALRSLTIAAALLIVPSHALALERLCEPAFENCRNPLISLIRAEKVGIDVAFWFMEDSRYATEIINRWKAGVRVRVLVDTEANATYPLNANVLKMFKDAGIPMRNKTRGGILHWKTMIFTGQNTVEFSAANYSGEAFAPGVPYADYVDEVIYFTDNPSYVGSFKTRYDDAWTDTTSFTDYANVVTRTREHPVFAIDPELNFVPWENFRTRSVPLYKAETRGIDVIMYRITDRAHPDQMIAAVARGVRVRLLTEPLQYRSAIRLWHAYNVDRMWKAGVEVKMRGHLGLNHEKLTLLQGQRMAIFGSSNWTSASASDQHEHNLFTTDSAIYTWMRSHFDRKWNNLGPSPESKPFVPLPPDTPSLKTPANGATGEPSTVTLKWYAGPWAHRYDVYFGTNPASLVPIVSDRQLGPSQSSSDWKSHTVSGLVSGRTYYWRVVGRTMADLEKTSLTWSFTVGSNVAAGTPLPAGWTSQDVGGVAAPGGATYAGGTFSVSGSGADIWGSADEFHFASRQMTGDGSIVARVASLAGVDAWTKAGVMMRDTLAPGARHASMFVSSSKGLAFQRRASTGGSTAHTAGAASTAPYWVRLVRSGNTFSAYVSPNGSAWTLVGTQSIAMGSTIHVGLAVTSHRDGTLATATFTNVVAP